MLAKAGGDTLRDGYLIDPSGTYMLTTCAQIKLVKTHDQWILWPRFGKIHVQDRGRNGYCLALFSFCSFFIPPKDSEFKCCWIYSFLIEPWNLYMIKHSLTPYKL